MFSKPPILTDVGKSILLRASGGEAFSLTKFQAGSGILAPGQTPQTMTALSHVELSNIGITKTEDTEDNGYIELTGTFNNSGVTEFKWTELGVIAEDEDHNEYLYAYAYDNENAEMIYPVTNGVDVEQTVKLTIFIGDTENITAYLLPATAYAYKADLDAHIAARNPHGTDYFDVGAAPAVHTHSALNITSGILPVERGGTGVDSYAGLFAALNHFHNAVFGAYTGDGAARLDIPLGFKPQLVAIFRTRNGGYTGDEGCYAIAPHHVIYYYTDQGTQAPYDTNAMLNAGHGGAGVTDNGFVVSQCQQGDGRYDMNYPLQCYIFIAYRQ